MFAPESTGQSVADNFRSKKPVPLICAELLCERATLLTRPRSSAGFFVPVINDVLTFLTIDFYPTRGTPGHPFK